MQHRQRLCRRLKSREALVVGKTLVENELGERSARPRGRNHKPEVGVGGLVRREQLDEARVAKRLYGAQGAHLVYRRVALELLGVRVK